MRGVEVIVGDGETRITNNNPFVINNNLSEITSC